ncbi:MAG: glycosyltransferase family 4 protein [Formivibrio sp.]|nr:glycosyltransferase family 4 protein [Formivibrio sp.]
MERYVLDLIAGLSQRGVLLRVVTRRLAWPSMQPHGVEFIVLPDWTPFSRINNYVFESRAVSHARLDWPIIGISRVPGGAKLAIVGGTHLGHLQNKGRLQPGLFDRLTIGHEKALYRGACSIVAHSERVRQEIIHHYDVEADRVITLYPPVDTTVFSLAARNGREALRQHIGVGPDELMLLFPSNNHTLKGADLILSALDGFDSRIRLVVVGKDALNHPRVINLGFRRDMPALYASADASILASKYEAFGLVGPESILCGTPVLFANTVGAIEVLSDAACVRFERTVNSLRAALASVLLRFEAETLALAEPGLHIHYPYSLDAHIDALMSQLLP